jgi:hypothetical protein
MTRVRYAPQLLLRALQEESRLSSADHFRCSLRTFATERHESLPRMNIQDLLTADLPISL